MALTLTVHHTIHLTREQRYALHAGNDVEAVGVSLPVWCDKDLTSEPGKEVFCKYVLKNTKKEIPIKTTPHGYEIVIPAKNMKPPKEEISNAEFWKMTEEELAAHYKERGPQASSKNLLDHKDGGSLSLCYREHNKIKFNKTMLNVVHFVNIEDMDRLLGSLEDPTTTAQVDNLLGS
jgi:hypothetical protein